MNSQDLQAALEYYYPPFYSKERVSTLKEMGKCKTAEKISEDREKVEQDLIKWWDVKSKNNEFMDALHRIEIKLGNLRSQEEFVKLKTLVVVACFFCYVFERGKSSPYKFAKTHIKDYIENLEAQKIKLNELIKLMEKAQEFTFQVAGVSVDKQNLTDVERIYLKVDDNNSANILFQEEFYVQMLKRRREHIEHFLEDKPYLGFDSSSVLKRAGALLYPGGLKNQAQSKNVFINSLIFNLVFLFRSYTDMTHESWLSEIKGPLPQSGKSHYDLIADLVNAIFEGKINKKGSQDELDGKNIQNRVSHWIEQKVEFTSWLFSYT